MSGSWFETVAEAQRRAERRLPRSVYRALLAGAEKGLSTHDNVDPFAQLGFAPHVADFAPTRDLATTVMGMSVSMPVLISPTGVQAVHPEGEVAMARAAATRGVAMGLSSFASHSIEQVAAVNSQVLFQMYWSGARDAMVARLARAAAAGVTGIILTLDWSFSHGRDAGSPWIPERIDLRAMLRLGPEVLACPPWFWSFARTGHPPSLTTPNMAAPGVPAPRFFGAYREWMASAPPTWADVAWLRAQWPGPFMVKGVCRVDDARRVVDLGASTLDGAPAPVRALPAVVDAVGDQVEVLLDGGVRRGSDVVKALALGARAVMIGRAYLWGLAANGQAGVENVLDILRGGIDSALLGPGHSSIHDLTADDVIIPPGFTRSLGAGDDPVG